MHFPPADYGSGYLNPCAVHISRRPSAVGLGQCFELSLVGISGFIYFVAGLGTVTQIGRHWENLGVHMVADRASMGLEELRFLDGEENEEAVTRLDSLSFERMVWEEYILRWTFHCLLRCLYR